MISVEFEGYTEKREEVEAIQFLDQSQASFLAMLLGSEEKWTLLNYPVREFELTLGDGRVLHRGDYVVRDYVWGCSPWIVSFSDFREKWQKKA